MTCIDRGMNSDCPLRKDLSIDPFTGRFGEGARGGWGAVYSHGAGQQPNDKRFDCMWRYTEVSDNVPYSA
jgi:hypothetical protein